MNKVLDLRSTEEILREQIRDLNALLDMKNKRIVELEALSSIPHLVIGNRTTEIKVPHVSTDMDREISTECNIPNMAYQCSNCTCGGK